MASIIDTATALAVISMIDSHDFAYMEKMKQGEPGRVERLVAMLNEHVNVKVELVEMPKGSPSECGRCGSDQLDWATPLDQIGNCYDGDMRYPYICDECGYKGVEVHHVLFGGHEDDID